MLGKKLFLSSPRCVSYYLYTINYIYILQFKEGILLEESTVFSELKHLFSLFNINVKNTEENTFGTFHNNSISNMSMVGRGSGYKHGSVEVTKV